MNDVSFECLEVYINQVRLRRSWYLFGVDLKESAHLLYKFNKALIQYTPDRGNPRIGSLLVTSSRMESREILYEVSFFQIKVWRSDDYVMRELVEYVLDYEQAKGLYEYAVIHDS